MKKITYYTLLGIFIILIFTSLVLLYMYNEEKKEVVKELEQKGFNCEKNIFGIYKTCSPVTINKWNISNLKMKK